MIPHDDMRAGTALNDPKVTPHHAGRVRIVLRAGRLRVVEPHHGVAPHVPRDTPILAERPVRRRWWRR